MEREEAVTLLYKLRAIAVALGKENVDDPENILSDLAGDSDQYRRALDVALELLTSLPFNRISL